MNKICPTVFRCFCPDFVNKLSGLSKVLLFKVVVGELSLDIVKVHWLQEILP